MIRLSETVEIHASVRLLWERVEPKHSIYGAYFDRVEPEEFDQLARYFEELPSQPGAPDRRIGHRRTATGSTILASVGNRKVDRRAGSRINHRNTLAARFLPDELRQLLFRRVVVTGIGVITPIGLDKNEFRSSLQNGQSGVRTLQHEWASQFPCRKGGEVMNFDPKQFIPGRRSLRMDKATQYAVAAAVQAFEDARFHSIKPNRRRIGVAVGTTMGGLGWAFQQHELFNREGFSRMHPYTIAAASPNACSGEVASALQAHGPCVTFAQGCTSAASAIVYGYDQIRSGHVDVMAAGGTEAPFLPSIYGAFCQSGIMANTVDEGNLPRPFSRSPGGVILAEGSGFLVLEELEHALARKAPIYAEIVGTAQTCDGFDMVQPRLHGLEPARAMELALESASLQSSDVSIVFSHGSGARAGDSTELKALRKVFKAALSKVYFCNTKSLMGYAQGATAAIECAAASLALQRQFVPPLLNTKSTELPLNFASVTRDAELKSALVNCFGFGGKNVSIVMRTLNV